MQHAITLMADPVAAPLPAELVADVAQSLEGAGLRVTATDWLAPARACDLLVDGVEDAAETGRLVDRTLGDAAVDRAVLPVAGRRKRLLISDMDSTVVLNETLDDLAVFAGVGEQVAAITRLSMEGRIDFIEAIETRVGLLRGLPAATLESAFEEVRITPGAVTAVRTMRQHGVHTVLVSGGFRYFTTRVARFVGFHEEEANELEVAEGRLTGRIVPPIINRDGKVRALHRIAAGKGIDIGDTLAVGDGANDLGMIEAAGLGVGFRGKPVVAERARVNLRHTDLSSLLFIQGYRESEFAA